MLLRILPGKSLGTDGIRRVPRYCRFCWLARVYRHYGRILPVTRVLLCILGLEEWWWWWLWLWWWWWRWRWRWSSWWCKGPRGAPLCPRLSVAVGFSGSRASSPLIVAHSCWGRKMAVDGLDATIGCGLDSVVSIMKSLEQPAILPIGGHESQHVAVGNCID